MMGGEDLNPTIQFIIQVLKWLWTPNLALTREGAPLRYWPPMTVKFDDFMQIGVFLQTT